MFSLERPSHISVEAWSIMLAVYKNYEKNDQYFEDFSQFNFSYDELDKYCEELQNNDYIFWECDGNGDKYIYMLPKILGCFKD